MNRQIGEHETKFVFPNNRSHILIAWLRLRCREDPKYPAGTISSVYYDSTNWNLLHEKINSDFLKTKVRLRWYSDSKTNTKENVLPTFLEVKYKIGSSRKKKRVETDISSDWISTVPLHDPQLLHIPQILQEDIGRLNVHLLPAFQVDYQRYRFIDPVSGARLCVDYNIHVPRANGQMISRNNPTCLQKGVFELKDSSGKLPEWLHQLTSLGCKKESFSKYAACYAHLMQVIF